MPKITRSTPDDDSLPLLHEEEANGFPDRVTSPQCKVCTSEYRNNVDLWLARGYSMASIKRNLERAGVSVSITSISRHRDNHLPMQIAAYREILEKNVDDYARAQGEGAIKIISGAAFLDMIVSKGMEAILDGKMDVEAKDVIKAIEVKAGMDEKGIDQIRASFISQMEAMRYAMEEVLTPDQARAVIDRGSEILDLIQKGQYTPPERGETINMEQKAIEEGEIVE